MGLNRFARIAALAFAVLLFAGCKTPSPRSHNSGPWNLRELNHAPAATWGARMGLVQEVYYQGEPFQGKPTRVFAYVGQPEGKGPFPGVVLVHGGGGKAFKDWADHWAQRGYVAISMDTAGFGPNGKLPDGGPDQSDQTKFRNFTAAEIPDMWTYHAVADAIRAHSLLLSLPEVDPNRTALTGISWGGYLTCIVAGLDHRFKAAVPVYGCGFLGEDSVWKPGVLAQMHPEARELWLKTFDPSQYLSGVSAPILFLNGSHDFAYPLDSYQKSFRLVNPKFRHVSIVMKLPHGHIWNFPEPDQFIDAALQNKSFPRVIEFSRNNAIAQIKSTAPLKDAQLQCTLNDGPWQKREWQIIPATVFDKSAHADIPEQFRKSPAVLLFTATTAEGLRISSEVEFVQ